MTLPISARAGTHLDHRFTEHVVVDGKRLGLIDASKSLYQFGGSASTCVLWKFKLLGLGAAEWQQVLDAGCGSIEFINSDKNECWQISVDQAKADGAFYDPKRGLGSGSRYGIPIDSFTITR